MGALRYVVLAAGGTGGHVFPAEALCRVLVESGTSVLLMTDPRGRAFTGGFVGARVRVIPSGGLVSGPLRKRIHGLVRVGLGTIKCVRSFWRERPDAVVGFGSYASLPPLLAAKALRIPIALHEQNSVMGATNRRFARSASLVGLSFPVETEAASGAALLVGNFVRPAVRDAASTQQAHDGNIRILVIGGSQGSSEISQVVPAAIAELDAEIRSRMKVLHQARREDGFVQSVYGKNGIDATISEFVDMPSSLAVADLVVARSGASTVWDVAVSGRPAVYLPLKTHRDLQQVKNAEHIASAGGALVVESPTDVDSVVESLRTLLENPSRLAEMGSAAAKWAGPDGAREFVAHLEAMTVKS